MFEIGRLCIKIAGRDAGKKCVVINIVDANTVEVDGETRRRKVSVRHVEPTSKVLKINKGASTDEIAKIFKSELDIEVVKTKPKPPTQRPLQQRKATTSTKSTKKPIKKPKSIKNIESPEKE